MKKAILVCTLIVLGLFCVACTTSKRPEATTEIGQETNTSQMGEDETFDIDTDFGTLKYPAKWKGKVRVYKNDKKISFMAGKKHLFDLLINSDSGYVLGTVVGEDKNTTISIKDYDVDDDEYAAMKEDANVILQHLMEDEEFVVGERVEKEDTATFDIKTSVVPLKYPEKWKDKVKIDVKADKVCFSSGKNKLFDLVFKECDGYLLGTYDKTPIYIIDYKVEGDELCAMQEDVNVILENLMQDKKFEINY